jgi:hypothetical protein
MRQKLPKQAEVQLLVNAVMSWAQQELETNRRFSAAAAWLVTGASEPELRTMTHSETSQALSIQQQEAMLATELWPRWQTGELAAVILAAPFYTAAAARVSIRWPCGCMRKLTTGTARTS